MPIWQAPASTKGKNAGQRGTRGWWRFLFFKHTKTPIKQQQQKKRAASSAHPRRSRRAAGAGAKPHSPSRCLSRSLYNLQAASSLSLSLARSLALSMNPPATRQVRFCTHHTAAIAPRHRRPAHGGASCPGKGNFSLPPSLSLSLSLPLSHASRPPRSRSSAATSGSLLRSAFFSGVLPPWSSSRAAVR